MPTANEKAPKISWGADQYWLIGGTRPMARSAFAAPHFCSSLMTSFRHSGCLLIAKISLYPSPWICTKVLSLNPRLNLNVPARTIIAAALKAGTLNNEQGVVAVAAPRKVCSDTWIWRKSNPLMMRIVKKRLNNSRFMSAYELGEVGGEGSWPVVHQQVQPQHGHQLTSAVARSLGSGSASCLISLRTDSIFGRT